MGGGIDKIYSRDMFPWVNKIVMEKISKLDSRVKLKRSFDKLHKNVEYPALPIGEAIITPLTDYERYETCYLVTAPTMIYPCSIKNTTNPKLAFSAVLKSIEEWNGTHDAEQQITTIICPGLGTGIGGIDPDDCAKQIFDAFLEKTFKKV